MFCLIIFSATEEQNNDIFTSYFIYAQHKRNKF